MSANVGIFVAYWPLVTLFVTSGLVRAYLDRHGALFCLYGRCIGALERLPGGEGDRLSDMASVEGKLAPNLL